MTDTPETDECVQANKHLKFLQEDHYVGNNKTTYENPIVFLSRKLERERDDAIEMMNRTRDNSGQIISSQAAENIQLTEQRDRLAEALEYILGIGLTQKTKAKAEKALQINE